MTEPATKTDVRVSQLKCIGCGRTALPDRFRCESCRDLLEIIFPGWEPSGPYGLDLASLKKLWLGRKSSFEPADQSGVWRFREVLPALPVVDRICTRTTSHYVARSGGPRGAAIEKQRLIDLKFERDPEVPPGVFPVKPAPDVECR